jgi:hypothetical protein
MASRSGGLGGFEDCVDALPGIRVEHEELAGMCARVAKEFEAVRLGTGESVLVPENDSSGVVLEFACADETAASELQSRSGDSVFLGVGIKGRDRILYDDAFADPALQRGCGAGVNVVLRRVLREDAAFFDGDEIMRIRRVIAFLHGGGDLVVGLREDSFERDALGIVAKSLEGMNLGHVVSGGVFCSATSPLVYAK